MAFELDTFEQIVNGNLAPWLFPQELNTQKHWKEYLQVELSNATRQVHTRFQQKDKQWIISEVDTHLFDLQQLPAFLRLQQQVQVPEVEGEVLLDLLLARLSLEKSSITEWYHWQDGTGKVQLEAYLRIAWESLSYEEQRYSFYQQLMAEQVQLTEQNMRDFVRNTAPRQAIDNYLQKHQQALVRFSDQLTENLGVDQAALIKSSGSYLLTDVMRLILQQVDKLSAFLIQESTGYLDPDLPVPYSHKVLTLKQHQVLVEELSGLVKYQVKNTALQKLLQEVLDDFKALPQQPTSLRQLAYWQDFLPQLEKLLKGQSNPESEYYLTGLTAVNFNHPGFFSWCQNLIEQELAGQHTASVKLESLYYFQKQIRQVRPVTEHAFDIKQPTMQAQLSDWISEEIRYWQQVAENQSNLSPEIERIPSNMTVAQMALLIRLLRESELLPEQNKAQMFRTFSQLFLSHKGEEFSAHSLRGKYFQQNDHTIAIMRERLIEMLDFLDGL